LVLALAHGLIHRGFCSDHDAHFGRELESAVTFGLLCGGHHEPLARQFVLERTNFGRLHGCVICLGFWCEVVVMGTPPNRDQSEGMQGILSGHPQPFFLVFVVYGTAVEQRGRGLDGFAIGATVHARYFVRGPLTGEGRMEISARVFGSSILAYGFGMIILFYWIGPTLSVRASAFRLADDYRT